MNINEGLRSGDLDNLILNIISIDEYESKILDDAIVVGFKAVDKEPAEDLSKFIEHSGLELLDSDVSPGPDDDGNYYVFVEFMRNKAFVEKLDKIIQNINYVTNIDEWQIQIYHTNELHPYSKENIKHNVRLNSDEVNEEIIEYIRDCYSDTVKLINEWVYFDNLKYKLISFGDSDKLYNSLGLYFKPVRLDETAQYNVKRLQRILGQHWSINQIDECLICKKAYSDKIIILKD